MIHTLSVNPILLATWTTLALCCLGLLLYRAHLDRYETEQLFLSEASVEKQQADKQRVAKRIARVMPAYRTIASAMVLMTAGVVGIYVWEAWQTIQ
jgi:hypothetical protein